MVDTKKREQIKNAFGKNLKFYLNDKGISRESFADSVGITTRLVYDYENGIKLPGVDTLWVIGEVLGLDSLNSLLN